MDVPTLTMKLLLFFQYTGSTTESILSKIASDSMMWPPRQCLTRHLASATIEVR